MPRWPAAVLLVATVSAGACRSDSVELEFSPAVGDRFTYRYEIEATITQTVEGRAPEVTELVTVVLSEQEVVAVSDEGPMVEVVLRRDGSGPRRAVVLLDRAGSLRAIEEVEGLPSGSSGLPGTDALPTPRSLDVPRRPLRLGDGWSLDSQGLTGTGRLARLAVHDGRRRATVESSLTEVLDSVSEVEEGFLRLSGRLATDVTTSYDLADGAIALASTSSRGTVAVVLEPPAGITASPIEAEITYRLEVRTARTG